jgi:hypothetical protein
MIMMTRFAFAGNALATTTMSIRNMWPILLLTSLFLSLASAEEMLFTVIYGENVPPEVWDQVDLDQGSLLAVMDASTPSYYSVSTAGSTTNDSVRRLFPIRRELFQQCPPKCKTSASTTCKALGCAMCGSRCRRRLRALHTESAMISDSATDVAFSIESNLDEDLSYYCENIEGCELWTEVYIVHEDGSLSDAI